MLRQALTRGKAVQVDPIKPTSKEPGIELLQLKYEQVLSSFAFKFNLRRYTVGLAAHFRFNDADGEFPPVRVTNHANASAPAELVASTSSVWNATSYTWAGVYTRPLFSSTDALYVEY